MTPEQKAAMREQMRALGLSWTVGAGATVDIIDDATGEVVGVGLDAEGAASFVRGRQFAHDALSGIRAALGVP